MARGRKLRRASVAKHSEAGEAVRVVVRVPMQEAERDCSKRWKRRKGGGGGQLRRVELEEDGSLERNNVRELRPKQQGRGRRGKRR